jgi:hypothetical protein
MAKRAPAVLVATLATACLLYAFHDRFWYPPDEGNYAHVAQRLLQGDTLNLQVQDVHPGYISFVNAAALRVFGTDLVSMRYPLALAGLVQAALLFLLFPREDPWRAAVASGALTALGAIQFLNPTAHWYCLALTVMLIAVLGTSRGPRQSVSRLLTVGLLIGTIVLFRQLTGFLAGVGAIAFLLWEAGERGTHGRAARLGRVLATTMAGALAAYLALATDISGLVLFGVWPLALLGRLASRPQASNREVAGIAATVAAGMALAALPLAAYHLWHGSVQAWADDVGPAAVALTRLDFLERSNFAALIYHAARQMVTSPSVPAILNGFYWVTLPLLAAVNGFLVLRRIGRAAPTAPLPVMPTLAVFYAVVSVHFQIPVYLYYSAGLSLASLLWLAPHVSPLLARASMALALTLAATGIYFQAGQPASRGITGILRGDRVLSTRASTLLHNSLRIDPEEGRRYEALVALIRREVPAGEAIFAVPSNAELYFMAERRNPFRFYNTALGVRSDEDLALVERTLRDDPPRLVTFDRDDKYNTPRSLRIMEMVRTRYAVVAGIDSFEVYVRR